MPRICCISDTHGHRPVLPAADWLIHAGDWTAHSDELSVRQFLTWFASQPHEVKVLIEGNHETWSDAQPEAFARLLAEFPSITHLHDESIEINGVRIFGSPYTPRFLDWAFNVDRGPDIQTHWDLIPSDTDVLITHGPPMGILDYVGPDRYNVVRTHVGCANLDVTIRERLKALKIHCFGHVHGPGGSVEARDNVVYVNASVVNERYELTNDPVLINL